MELPLMDEVLDKSDMLRQRREFLEQRLKDKYSELTKVCVNEAELTGMLPIETPFSDDGSLPKFRPVLRTVSLNSDDFSRMFDSNPKKVEVVSKKNGRVKGSPKKSRIRAIWETLPSIGRGNDSALASLVGLSSDITTWPHRTSPTKANRPHPYSIHNKS